MTKTVSLGMDEWNPFEEDTFGNETEDSIFGKEFDKLRRGSNSSKDLWCIFMNTTTRLPVVLLCFLWGFFSLFFITRLLSVLHGHSFFHPRHNGQ